MTYKDGDETDMECSTCKVKLLFEMSFQDQFSHTSGHYTTDYPILVCPKCDKVTDFVGDEDE